MRARGWKAGAIGAGDLGFGCARKMKLAGGAYGSAAGRTANGLSGRRGLRPRGGLGCARGVGRSERGEGGSSRAGLGREGSWAAGFAGPGGEGVGWAGLGFWGWIMGWVLFPFLFLFLLQTHTN